MFQVNEINGGGELLVRLNSRPDDEAILKPLQTQIGGHGSEHDGQRGLLKHGDEGIVLKPVQPPPRGQRETTFYKTISKSTDPKDVELRKHIPRFFGIEEVGFINGVTVTEEFLALEDITDQLRLPNVMDVKIGRRTWGPDATVKKRKQEDGKYAGTKGPFGFSVLGLIVHSIRSKSDRWTRQNKSFGKTLKTQDVKKVPRIFFDIPTSGVVPELINGVVKRLKAILEVVERQNKYRFFASSILLAYDAAGVREFLEDGDVEKLERNIRVKIIDFAHVFPASEGEKDENFVFGLKNLIALFESVLL